jgi:hypothetical protein
MVSEDSSVEVSKSKILELKDANLCVKNSDEDKEPVFDLDDETEGESGDEDDERRFDADDETEEDSMLTSDIDEDEDEDAADVFEDDSLEDGQAEDGEHVLVKEA